MSVSSSPPARIPVAQLQGRLARLFAERWSLPGAVIAPLPGGINAHVWSVDVPAGRFVAKAVVDSVGEHFGRGLAAAARVQAGGVASGAPVACDDGRLTADSGGYTLALLAHVPGDPVLGRGERELRLIGATLARAHLALGTVEARAELSPALDFGPHTAVRPWVRPALARMREAAVGLESAWLTWGELHGDPAGESFLLDPEGGQCGLIDWGAYTRGPRVYDLASAVMYAGGIGHADALVDGYLEYGPVGAGEVERALGILLGWRWAVQASYFAWRIAQNDMTGIADAAQNEKGLADAKAYLAPPEIRAYQASDEPSWLRCRVLAFLDTCYYDDVWTRKPDEQADSVVELVAVDEGEVVGILDVAVRGELATIENVCVLPAYRGAGLATRLLCAACERLAGSGARFLDAWTREDQAAIAWYEACGFAEEFTYLHVYTEYNGAARMVGKHPPYSPMVVFAHALREHEQQARAEYPRVYVCRRMMQPFPAARFTSPQPAAGS